MPRVFPRNFDLRALKGPSAGQFTSREDAFQQLVGDALVEMAGTRAQISPTRGTDGSIDAFVEDGGVLTGPFEGLPCPLIVECKAHDDAVKDLRKNIFEQWGRTKKKLEANATAGWQGLFQPWQTAKGYAYCVSSFLQNPQVRADLTQEIETFFTSLASVGHPPMEVRVIDWNDLRQWLDTLPNVADKWLGIELDLILDHSTYLKRLTGFREFLLPSKLEFVPPATDSPFHPARILEELSKSDGKSGMLLVGAGGVGKTRTVIEVANQAVEEGWRVLHVLPEEPGIEAEDVAREVLSYRDKPALLVFDYLDQMQRLDLGSIRRSLIPEAKERRIKLRLLANCRPGWMSLANLERDELLNTTELRPSDSQKARITEVMVDRIAPAACYAIGRDEVIRLCGTRAIIALLIARELESRARTDLLKELSLENLRSGDLVQWLRRRLLENSLSVRPDPSSLRPPRPDEPMVAAAAALACAPEYQEVLASAAQAAYEQLGCETAKEDAQFLVQLLLKLGWMEEHGPWTLAVHDFVADEVLDQTIHTGTLVYEKEFVAVLACALRIPRAIGRLATALRRVLAAVQDSDASARISDFANEWLQNQATALGKVLETGDTDVTGYALGALLSGPPWDEATIQAWEKLVLPWLKAHSAREEARHLLYKGLSHQQIQREALVSPALSWLVSHGLESFASFVVGPLLYRDDLEVNQAAGTRSSAIQWLEEHHDRLDAKFVLKPLLERADLEGNQAAKARTFAIQWLEEHHDRLDAQFVLKPLLERSDLTDDQAAKARNLAIQWLEKYKDALEAKFVFRRLLERSDLTHDQATNSRNLAVQWLENHNDALEAGFVLRPLLERSDLTHDQATNSRNLAVQWLEKHNDALEAGFVLQPLLERAELTGEHAALTGAAAVQWLERHHDARAAGLVLSSLLSGTILSQEQAQIIVNLAIVWLGQFPDTTDADFVLMRLFRRSEIPPAHRTPLLFAAIERLRGRLLEEHLTFLLRSCLQYRNDDEELQRELLVLAIEWLDLHPDNAYGDYVWNRVLRYPILADDDWLPVAHHALRWLKGRSLQDKGVDQTTNSLLTRPHLLDVSDREYVVKLAMALLRTNPPPSGRRRLLTNLKRLRDSLREDH